MMTNNQSTKNLEKRAFIMNRIVKIEAGFEVVLPLEYCQALALAEGDLMIAEFEAGRMVLRPLSLPERQAGTFESGPNELIAERRAEAESTEEAESE
jgi:hypothetical protein